jgi:Skp family chaperone for outer membrane proteins
MSVKRQLRAAAVAFAILSMGAIGSAAGQTPSAVAGETATMLVVDTEQVLSVSKAVKGVQIQDEAQKQALEKEFSKRQEELRLTEAELRKEQSSLPAEVFQEKARAFEKRVAETQREASLRNQALDEGYRMAISKVKLGLVQVCRDIAAERGVTMVARAELFLVISPASIDVSADALRRLDLLMPSVQLVIPKPPQPGAAPSAVANDGSAAPPVAAPPAKKK